MELKSNRNTFSIKFYIIRLKENSKGEHPIYCRLTINGKRKEFSTHIWVVNTKWNPIAGKVIGNSEAARTFNASLESTRLGLLNCKSDL
ncbi:MAG: Arm DNA-binding domain-containing protein, partial [Pedobacter sp.]